MAIAPGGALAPCRLGLTEAAVDARGVAIHEVSWMLGHANIAITADTLGHAIEASERRTADMQAALTG
jgi:hypothetical protein